jgi:hypothetical protein
VSRGRGGARVSERATPSPLASSSMRRCAPGFPAAAKKTPTARPAWGKRGWSRPTRQSKAEPQRRGSAAHYISTRKPRCTGKTGNAATHASTNGVNSNRAAVSQFTIASAHKRVIARRRDATERQLPRGTRRRDSPKRQTDSHVAQLRKARALLTLALVLPAAAVRDPE